MPGGRIRRDVATPRWAGDDAPPTRGNWGEVWDNFDRRQNAKAANDVPEAGGDGDDMFTRAGVAAE